MIGETTLLFSVEEHYDAESNNKEGKNSIAFRRSSPLNCCSLHFSFFTYFSCLQNGIQGENSELERLNKEDTDLTHICSTYSLFMFQSRVYYYICISMIILLNLLKLNYVCAYMIIINYLGSFWFPFRPDMQNN